MLQENGSPCLRVENIETSVLDHVFGSYQEQGRTADSEKMREGWDDPNITGYGLGNSNARRKPGTLSGELAGLLAVYRERPQE
jgi:hypothetical protein